MFIQDAKEFFRSKTNWTGITSIATGLAGFYSGEFQAAAAVGLIMGGFMAISLKDAISKV